MKYGLTCADENICLVNDHRGEELEYESTAVLVPEGQVRLISLVF